MTLIKVVNGDLLDAEENLILHSVNCQGKMNSGVAKAIRGKWGRVYDKYMELCGTCTPNYLLGQVQSVLVDDSKGQHVINMFTQEFYGYDGNRYTSYDALYECLEQVANVARKRNLSVALPYKLSSDRGGASWAVVYAMIEEVFKNHTQPVVIYNLGGQWEHSFNPKAPKTPQKELVLN